jgi:hypothetical protein
VLPIKDLANQKIAYLKMGDATNDTFLSIKKIYEVTEIVDDNFVYNQIKSIFNCNWLSQVRYSLGL